MKYQHSCRDRISKRSMAIRWLLSIVWTFAINSSGAATALGERTNGSSTEAVERQVYLAAAPASQPAGVGNGSSPSGGIQATGPVVLTKISQIRQLRRSEASQGLPVRLTAVITYADPSWRNCFIQDQTGAAYVDLERKDAVAGQWVELVGRTGAGAFLPEIHNPTLRLLGTTNLPQPVHVDLQDLTAGQWDCAWIEMTGVVRRLDENDGHVYLNLTTGKGRFRALLPGFRGRALPRHLVDAVVTVQGACGSDLNAQRQLISVTLHAPSLDQVKILESAPADPFSIPLTQIASVTQFDTNRLGGRRVRIKGVVTMRTPGEGFIVQDNSGGIRVRTIQTNEVHLDQEVEVVGFPDVAGFAAILEEAFYRTNGMALPPAPKRTTAEEILVNGTNDASIIRIEARLLQGAERSSNSQLILQDEEFVFTAQMESPTKSGEIPLLPVGSRLCLVGVCSIDGTEPQVPKSFRLVLRSPADIALVSRPPWWSARHSLWLLAGAGTMILLAVAWVTSLRKQVSQRTRELQEENAERKRIENALRESQAIYHSLVEHLPINIYRKDCEGRFIFVNSHFCQFKGRSADQILGKTMFDLNPKELADQFAADDEKVIKTGQAIEIEEESRDHLNQVVYLQVVKSPVFGPDGAIVGTQGMFYDITARRKVEAELAYERDLLRTLLENSPDQIYFKDLNSRFVKCSQAVTARFGVETTDEVIGKCDSDFFRQEHANRAFEDEQEIIRTGQPIVNKVEKEYWKNDDKVTWVLSTKVPLRNRAGTIIGTFGISKDITAIKEAETKLQEVHRQLLEASRQAGMAEVATGVLHNIGNVLNSVNVSAALIAERVRNLKIGNLAKGAAMLYDNRHDVTFLSEHEKGKQLPKFFVQLAELWVKDQAAIADEISSLTKNIDHIKDIVVMQQAYAKISGVSETAKLSDLVEDALRMNAGALARHDVHVLRDFQEMGPVVVDKHKVLQILINLVHNAKYACDESGRPDKEIKVRIRHNEANKVTIEVSDNGIGIPAENLTRIFAHGFTTRKQGHGFGLHSCALASKQMGGELRVHSDGVGRGATFILELPLNPGAPSLT